MLGASPDPCRVVLKAAAIPALAGALPLLEQGWASSLAPSNARALTLLEERIQLDGPADAARLGLLIDPQTCGPLLAAIPADQCDAALAALQQAGFARAALIGQVHT